MNSIKAILFILILGFVAGIIYGILGSLLRLPAQEASIAGAVTFSFVVAIVFVFLIYNQLKKQP